MRWLLSGLLATLTLGALPVRAEQVSRRELLEASRELSGAVRDRSVDDFLDAARTLIAAEHARTTGAVSAAYAEFARRLEEDSDWRERYRLHSKVSAAFAGVTERSALREMERIRRRDGDWRSRLLMLDAASFNEKLDLEQCALEALRDDAPAVIRRSLDYLSRDLKVPVVEAIVARYLELEERKEGASPDWNRTLFAFHSALRRMLHVEVPAAADWKNYVEAYKGSEDFFKPPEERKRSERTAITLFGAAVTGKNIVFVIDVSGSMMSTDPLPPEERRRGRTTVGGGTGIDLEALEKRRRIARARKELDRVVRSLPEDVRFNLIAYSSEVKPWKKALVEASETNKAAASEYIAGLEATGVTVTDLALEEAFSDLEIDTVYLVTDGAPTHIGSGGLGLPEDSRRLIGQIHERIGELNFLRGVRIFTLGFRGAEVEFLEKLASDHGGRFVAIR